MSRTPQQWGDSQQEMRLVAADTGERRYNTKMRMVQAVADAIATARTTTRSAMRRQRAKERRGVFTRFTVPGRGGEVELPVPARLFTLRTSVARKGDGHRLEPG